MCDAANRFLIQSRLPGVQGENGCWSDEDVVEAHSPEDAIKKWADFRIHDPEGKLYGIAREFCRVCVAPEYREFRVSVQRTFDEQSVIVDV